jgi:predicted transposase YbfD/YdcC
MPVTPAWCWRKRGVRRAAQEGELAAAQRLLGDITLTGRLVTGDALYCQRAFCAQVLAAGADYLLTVKGNQRALSQAIQQHLATVPPYQRGAAEQTDRHGDRWETRRLETVAPDAALRDWPGLQQVFCVTRTVQQNGTTRVQRRLGITSLSAAQAEAALLLVCKRGHWRIENRLHWRRDVTLGEDACPVRCGAAPEVLAALRNAVLTLLDRDGVRNVAAALRAYAWQPGTALCLLGLEGT